MMRDSWKRNIMQPIKPDIQQRGGRRKSRSCTNACTYF